MTTAEPPSRAASGQETPAIDRRIMNKHERTGILEVLEKAAQTSSGVEFVQEATLGSGQDLSAQVLSYTALYKRAKSDACVLRDLHAAHERPSEATGTIFLLYFAHHADNIRWFWAATAAGYTPCIAPPFVHEKLQREKHIAHLIRLLNNPITLTRHTLASVFADNKDADIVTVESLRLAQYEGTDDFDKSDVGSETNGAQTATPHKPGIRGPAALLLTSGSTGNAKAVCLTHEQILAAVEGKSSHSQTTSKDIFLNWTGLDHAVCLVETHLQAVMLAAQQIHVEKERLLADPFCFLRLIHKHHVTATFSPNFFLHLIVEKIAGFDPQLQNPENLSLSSLRCLFSGGEANTVQTAIDLTKALRAYGAQGEFIHPGYGLTESCAGVTWGHGCPSYDAALDREFTSCGTPIPGSRLRVISSSSAGRVALQGEPGELQLSGPVIFKNYFNDPEATAASFTSDGWFKTGDLACLDANNQLRILGRIKDTININGVKIFCADVEATIEQVRAPGIVPSFVAVFPYRPPGARTESYCVVYRPTKSNTTSEMRAHAADTISRVASAMTNVRPFRVLALPDDGDDGNVHQAFAKSSIGKLSRSKIRAAFEEGVFQPQEYADEQAIRTYKADHHEPPADIVEQILVDIACETLGLPALPEENHVSVDANLFHLGLTSLDFFAFLRRVQEAPFQDNCCLNLSVTDLLAQPTVRGIRRLVKQRSSVAAAVSLRNPDPDAAYNPVVCLQPHGQRTPLWIVHPASGNVLAFVPLARYLSNRRVYGLRAQGLLPGESFAKTIHGMADKYAEALLREQPEGPYALAGYSLGSTIAYEMAKIIIAAKGPDSIRFLGALDSPPHISPLVGGLTWSACLVMVSFFLGLIPEKYSNTVIPMLWDQPRDMALAFIMQNSDPKRLDSLSLDGPGLAHIADLANSFGTAARDYSPEGKVPHMDVFIVDPLLSVTEHGRKDWKDRFLSNWCEFVEGEVVYHQCEGSHADMLDWDHVRSFQRALQQILNERGI